MTASHTSRDDEARFRFLTDSDIESLTPPEWLIDGIIPSHSLSLLFGPPGEGKSFVALDFALSIATGMPWAGNAVREGIVIYVAAEGVSGLGLRVRAWKVEHDVDEPTGVLFCREAVQLHVDSDVNAFIDAARSWQPSVDS